jgi:hypothetical protein
MFFTILSNIPLYVFPLAVFLAFLGYRSSKDRVVPVLLVYACLARANKKPPEIRRAFLIIRPCGLFRFWDHTGYRR